MLTLRPAALAFEAVAPNFDHRFAAWQSVAAQRRAVRRVLLEVFPPGGRIFELGGGTGEDAVWLAERNFSLFLTDPSPAMVERAKAKLAPSGSLADIAAAEELESFAERYAASGGAPFDAAFSNFAPLNCVEDISSVARGLARLLRSESPAVLVMFGTTAPGEIVVECLRGRPKQALRRFRRGSVQAELGGFTFAVRYHRRASIVLAMQPWFRLVRRRGIGIFVPPSAAEPWISRHPKLLGCLEWADRLASRPLARLGDHVLYHFERTAVKAP
jgi:ubiquinone/menaquinone biosynthesis C-methylase UbiE